MIIRSFQLLTILALASSRMCFGYQLNNEVTGEEFLKIAHSSFEGIEDFVLGFEGTCVFVGPKQHLGKGVDGMDVSFDGMYAWNNKNNRWIDSYKLDRFLSETGRCVRTTKASLGADGMQSIASMFSPTAPTVSKMIADPYEFRGLTSPEELIFFSHFNFLKSLPSSHYRFVGWVEGNGRKLLCADISRYFSEKLGIDKGDYYRFWIDVERGFHPVAVECYSKEVLSSRTEIVLSQVEVNGQARWFPQSCTLNKYIWNNGVSKDPMIIVKCGIVDGSIRFNQKFPDDFFSIKNRIEKLHGIKKSSVLIEFEKEGITNLTRVDPVTSQRNLEVALRRADQQSEMLASTNIDSGSSAWSASAFLAVAGFVLIVVSLAAYYRKTR